jgi:hypothetical protein
VFEIRARKRVSWKCEICASSSTRANPRVKKQTNKQTNKQTKKERKKEREIHTFNTTVVLWLSSSVSILSKHHSFLFAFPTKRSHFFAQREGKEKSVHKVIQKKSGAFPGRGTQRRCREPPPFCGNDDSRSRRRNQPLLKESFCDDDDDVVVVVYASRRDSDDSY